jgi:hypothetical protein
VAQIKRLSLSSAVDDRLYFAQVREDPRLEIEALHVEHPAMARGHDDGAARRVVTSRA